MHNHISQIKTPSLLVRKYRLSDAAMLKEVCDANIEYLAEWMPWAKAGSRSLSETQETLKDWIEKFENHKDFFYGIFDHSQQNLIGSTGLHKRLGKRVFEIGYWIKKEETQKGYATEVSYALTKTGLNYLGAEKIEIRCDPKNLISAKIPSKLGFMKEYSLRSFLKNDQGKRQIHDCWTLFKEEFQVMNEYEPVVINQF
ncbi:MAG: GNAT family N-acetyltransferase [Chitinophagales bacterium]|nr:GNAT family N-acetyltransferase [Chitinophagales bacterium]